MEIKEFFSRQVEYFFPKAGIMNFFVMEYVSDMLTNFSRKEKLFRFDEYEEKVMSIYAQKRKLQSLDCR